MQPPSPNSPTVFVVDDDEQLRDSLRALLEVLNFQVRAFSTPGSFHRYYRAEMPGCLLLDLRMPRQNGLQLYEQLLREGKRLPVIFVTAHADVTSAVAAMKSGAIEFLEKPFDRETLLNLVIKALQLDSEWRAQDAQLASLESRITCLNERERETLALIQTGDSNKAMAAKLFLSERAVEMRRSAIMRKLQVGSVAELLDLTITHRILSDLRAAADQRLRG
ncbi:MAG: response regulator [Bythopirellula sp.]|nr:response regulator [Bythopirellula sp.]